MSLLLYVLSHTYSSSVYSDIKRYFPSAHTADINGAGHWVHADKPIELLQALKQFILS